MPGSDDKTGSVEVRLDTIEDQLGESDFETIENRVRKIETEQSKLEDDFIGFVQTVRCKAR